MKVEEYTPGQRRLQNIQPLYWLNTLLLAACLVLTLYRVLCHFGVLSFDLLAMDPSIIFQGRFGRWDRSFFELAFLLGISFVVWTRPDADRVIQLRWVIRLGGFLSSIVIACAIYGPDEHWINFIAYLVFFAFAVFWELPNRSNTNSLTSLVKVVAISGLVFAILAVIEVERKTNANSEHLNGTVASTKQQNQDETSTENDQVHNLKNTDSNQKEVEPSNNRLLLSTVRIVNESTDGVGSGVILAQTQGSIYVLTAAHVVDDSQHLEIHCFSGSSSKPTREFSTVSVLATNSVNDLAMLQVTTDNELPVNKIEIAPSGSRTSDEAVFVTTFGCSDGKAPSELVGSAKPASIRQNEGGPVRLVWEFNRSSDHGRSGGPMLDEKSDLIGIASGVAGKKSYFAHLSALRKFLVDNDLQWILRN